MRYDEVIGQEALIARMSKAISEKTCSHAMLFCGHHGYGPLPLVWAMAKHLLCQEPGANGSCNRCNSCRKVETLTHPDLHLAFPVVKKEGKARKDTTSADFMPAWREALDEDAYLSLSHWLLRIASTTSAGDINVAECHRILHQLKLKSFGGQNKIQIIWMADLLGNNGNRLLKLLEEPPPYTYIFLIVENQDTILRTIQSRCQIVRIPKIENRALQSYLQTSHHLAEGEAHQLVIMADGSISRSMDYLTMRNKQWLPMMLTWMDVCYSADPVRIRDWQDQWDSLGLEEKKAAIQYLIHLLGEFLKESLLGVKAARLTDEEHREISHRPFLGRLTTRGMERIHELLSESVMLLERNINPRILFFEASLQLERILKTGDTHPSGHLAGTRYSK